MKCVMKSNSLLRISTSVSVLVATTLCCISAEVLPKNYIAYFTDETIAVDGKADEKSWAMVPWSDDFIDIEGVKKPKYQTRMKMMWGKDALYIYTEMMEPHVWGDITRKDSVIFYNNDIEVFIDPDGDTHHYYELEINALNTVWDLFISKAYRDYGVTLNNWDFRGLKSAVHIDGTLNNPKDLDKKWSCEIAIPWLSINERFDDKSIAPAGDTWRMNFSRVNWDFDVVDGKYQRMKDPKTSEYADEYNWVWAPTGVINIHLPEKWGYVYFSEKNVGEKDVFKYGKDELLKAEIYALHRKLRNEYRSTHDWNLNVLPKEIVLGEHRIPIKAEKPSKGYVMTVVSPFTGDEWFITDSGRLSNKLLDIEK